jgi:hypothetical protein
MILIINSIELRSREVAQRGKETFRTIALAAQSGKRSSGRLRNAADTLRCRAETFDKCRIFRGRLGQATYKTESCAPLLGERKLP